jgi:hypothetical protein
VRDTPWELLPLDRLSSSDTSTAKEKVQVKRHNFNKIIIVGLFAVEFYHSHTRHTALLPCKSSIKRARFNTLTQHYRPHTHTNKS